MKMEEVEVIETETEVEVGVEVQSGLTLRAGKGDSAWMIAYRVKLHLFCC